jgi:hypothetical protein
MKDDERSTGEDIRAEITVASDQHEVMTGECVVSAG